MTQATVPYKTFSIRTSLKTAYQLTKDNFAKLVFFQLILAGLFFALRGLLSLAFSSSVMEHADGFIMQLLLFFNLCLSFKLFDKKDIGVSDLVTSWKSFFPYLGSFIIYMTVFLAGIFCFILPGIFIAIRWGASPYFIIDKNSGVFESLKQSWKLTKGVFWKIFGACILLILIETPFQLISHLTLLVISPPLALAAVSMYRQLVESEEAMQKDVPVELIPATN